MDPNLINAIESVARPNWTDVLQAIGAIVSVFVSVLGFAFLWVQIQGLNRALHSETHGKIFAEDFDIAKIFLERPRLRPYFYGNVEIQKDDVDYGMVETIAELYVCHFEHVMLQSKYLPTDIRQSWLEYVRYLYRSSPPIRDCYFCMRKEGVYTERMDRFLFGTQAEAFGTALAVKKADFQHQQDAIV